MTIICYNLGCAESVPRIRYTNADADRPKIATEDDIGEEARGRETADEVGREARGIGRLK